MGDNMEKLFLPVHTNPPHILKSQQCSSKLKPRRICRTGWILSSSLPWCLFVLKETSVGFSSQCNCLSWDKVFPLTNLCAHRFWQPTSISKSGGHGNKPMLVIVQNPGMSNFSFTDDQADPEGAFNVPSFDFYPQKTTTISSAPPLPKNIATWLVILILILQFDTLAATLAA